MVAYRDPQRLVTVDVADRELIGERGQRLGAAPGLGGVEATARALAQRGQRELQKLVVGPEGDADCSALRGSLGVRAERIGDQVDVGATVEREAGARRERPAEAPENRRQQLD